MKSNFLLNAIFIAALMSLAFKFTGSPILNVQAYSAPEIEATVKKLKPLDNPTLKTLLVNGEHKTLLFVYASWCAVCKKQYPAFLEVSAKAKTAGINVVPFSLDEKPEALARFLLAQPTLSNTTYYIYKAGAVISVLKEIGSGFDNRIPYTAVVAPDGKILAEFEGEVEKTVLLKALGI